MGCTTSKVDSLESVQLCKNRKMFIEHAVEYRSQFASSHNAYVESMRRVSSALQYYVEGEEYNESLVDALFPTQSFTPVKKINSSFITISSKSFTMKASHPEKSSLKVNYCKSGGSPSVTVEEKPQPLETVRVSAYSPVYQYGMDGFLAMHSVPTSSSFYQSSPNNRPKLDSFWDPFSSLDYYGYPVTSSLDQTLLYDDNEISRVRKGECIPRLDEHVENPKERSTQILKDSNKEENVNHDKSDDDKIDCPPIAQELQPNDTHNTSVSNIQNEDQLSSKHTSTADCEAKDIHVNTRQTSMVEAIKDLDIQFRIACNSAKVVSALLEAVEVQNSSVPNDLTSAKMLKPLALLSSGSARTFSSTFLANPLIIDDDSYASDGDFSGDSRFCCSHQSTLDRLRLWEKKLYHEVRACERMRLAYEKKCAQLKIQEENKTGLPSINKTKAAIGDLLARIKVSIHTVEAISKRIETLRDEELQLQLLQLMQELGKMWKVMADSHRLQKCTLDEAKIILGSVTPSKDTKASPPSEPQQLGRSAVTLETELRNWHSCFESWIISQRSYLHALKGWLLSCVNANPITPKLSSSPGCCSVGDLPILNICIQWSRLLDSINEVPVLNGLDFFIAGLVSLYPQQLRGDPNIITKDHSSMVVGAGKLDQEEALTAEKMAEAAIGVVFSGMSVSIGALAEFAICSEKGYSDLLRNWEENKG